MEACCVVWCSLLGGQLCETKNVQPHCRANTCMGGGVRGYDGLAGLQGGTVAIICPLIHAGECIGATTPMDSTAAHACRCRRYFYAVRLTRLLGSHGLRARDASVGYRRATYDPSGFRAGSLWQHPTPKQHRAPAQDMQT